jgi:hypothetical protein
MLEERGRGREDEKMSEEGGMTVVRREGDLLEKEWGGGQIVSGRGEWERRKRTRIRENFRRKGEEVYSRGRESVFRWLFKNPLCLT